MSDKNNVNEQVNSVDEIINANKTNRVKKSSNAYTRNQSSNKIVIGIMIVVMLICLVYIGYVFTTMNGKGTIAFNNLSNTTVDPYINKDKYNSMNKEAIEVVTTVGEANEVYGYASESNVIIPDDLCTGTKSRIGMVALYLGDKDGTLMAAYKINNTYYYYVTDNMDYETFVSFLKSQWQ